MVGLEETFYQVTEGVGVVEVCAVVYSPDIPCPINFPFSAVLSTKNDTAGIRVFLVCHSTVNSSLKLSLRFQSLPQTMSLCSLLCHLVHVAHGAVRI